MVAWIIIHAVLLTHRQAVRRVSIGESFEVPYQPFTDLQQNNPIELHFFKRKKVTVEEKPLKQGRKYMYHNRNPCPRGLFPTSG